MISSVFSVLDVKAEFYMPTQTAPTIAMGVRMFLEAAVNPESMINKYPDDYVFFEIGTYNDHDASFKMLESKISHGSARELMAANPPAVRVVPPPVLGTSPNVSQISTRAKKRLKKGRK